MRTSPETGSSRYCVRPQKQGASDVAHVPPPLHRAHLLSPVPRTFPLPCTAHVPSPLAGEGQGEGEPRPSPVEPPFVRCYPPCFRLLSCFFAGKEAAQQLPSAGLSSTSAFRLSLGVLPSAGRSGSRFCFADPFRPLNAISTTPEAGRF